MEDTTKSKKVCKRCGKPFETALSIKDKDLYCNQCKIELAEKSIQDIEITSSLLPSKPRKKLTAFKWVSLILLSGLIVFNLASMLLTYFQQRPQGFETPLMNKDVILCLTTLSEVSKFLTEGQLPPDTIVCPVSGKPYRIEIEGGVITAYCPNPEIHNVKNLWVSRENPIPEVAK